MTKFNDMDYLSLIKQPIESDLNYFIELFNQSLTLSDGLLSHATYVDTPYRQELRRGD